MISCRGNRKSELTGEGVIGTPDDQAGVHANPVGSRRVAEQFVDHRDIGRLQPHGRGGSLGDMQRLNAFNRDLPSPAYSRAARCAAKLPGVTRRTPAAGLPQTTDPNISVLLISASSETAKQVRSPKRRSTLTEIWAFKTMQLFCSWGSRQRARSRIPIFIEPTLEVPTSEVVPFLPHIFSITRIVYAKRISQPARVDRVAASSMLRDRAQSILCVFAMYVKDSALWSAGCVRRRRCPGACRRPQGRFRTALPCPDQSRCGPRIP